MIKQNNNYAQLNSSGPTSYIYHFPSAFCNFEHFWKCKKPAEGKVSVWQQTRHLQEFQTFSSNWSDWNKLELENPGDRANKGFEDTHDF